VFEYMCVCMCSSFVMCGTCRCVCVGGRHLFKYVCDLCVLALCCVSCVCVCLCVCVCVSICLRAHARVRVSVCLSVSVRVCAFVLHEKSQEKIISYLVQTIPQLK
jgi:hypothetical protein